MDTVYFKGTPCHTFGQMPAAGSKAPSFNLAGADLSPVKSADYEGKTVVLNIFPSLDTDVCARSVRKFNETSAPSIQENAESIFEKSWLKSVRRKLSLGSQWWSLIFDVYFAILHPTVQRLEAPRQI